MPNRSDKQESALNKRRNSGLEDAASKDPGFSCQGKVGEFIGLYLRCELFATRIQHYYQADKQYKKGKLNTEMLSKALEYFAISFAQDKLHAVFKGGEGKRGKKSARQLRNGYLHQLSDPDKLEILDKYFFLVNEMNRLLKKRIKT